MNLEFLETLIWKYFLKMKPGFLEFSETWVWEFLKMNPGFFEVSETLKKIIQKKNITKEITFYKTIQMWHFKKIRLQQAQRKNTCGWKSWR